MFPKKVLISACVVAEPPAWIWENSGHDERKYFEALEAWVQELNALIRDHRSQDGIHLRIERQYKILCPVCNRALELIRNDDGSEECASCCEKLEKDEPVKC